VKIKELSNKVELIEAKLIEKMIIEFDDAEKDV
jgi:hypothetical protein